jgi:hypothetical protein
MLGYRPAGEKQHYPESNSKCYAHKLKMVGLIFDERNPFFFGVFDDGFPTPHCG